MKALNENGYSVPDNVAVISFDDMEIASFMNPPLTTVHVPKEELGSMAEKILINRIENSR